MKYKGKEYDDDAGCVCGEAYNKREPDEPKCEYCLKGEERSYQAPQSARYVPRSASGASWGNFPFFC